MEEGNQWHDPLLITDVSCQQHHKLNFHSDFVQSSTSTSAQNFVMADFEDFDMSRNDGRSLLGFSFTSPDLVICAGSPDIPKINYEENSPKPMSIASVELSLENGIDGSQIYVGREAPTASNIPAVWERSNGEVRADGSFELPPPPPREEKISEGPVISINVGSIESTTVWGGITYSEDSCFHGGDTVGTDARIGDDGGGLSLYQTARFGNFSYHFKDLDPGIYMVDLHFAEIVFVDGPPGLRIFDVFIQEDKAVSCLDIYARVGANSPLVVPALKTYVSSNGLSIRFEGVCGFPIVCGISIRKDNSLSLKEVECLKMKDLTKNVVEGELETLQSRFDDQKKELMETKTALEELKRENELKCKECQEAWNSLKELQNELMRKSMHVGSLAFAIEGQVKEKSRWFSSLRDLTSKMKILKMEQIKLSEEASAYQKCLADMNDLNIIVQSKMKEIIESHEDLRIKFIEGAKEKKELYNKVLELKGNIRVFCRCRPLNTEEITAGAVMAIDFEAAKDGELTVKSNGSLKKTFKFDAVFSPQAEQVDVFADTAPFVTSVLDGYNVCIFAYGQTGTGKTFTMEGTNEARGVNFRTLAELFRIIEEQKDICRYEISVSVLEVYNEQIRDLLSGPPPGGPAKKLKIRQVGEGIHHVPGLVEAHVNNTSEVWEVLQTGSNARATGSTNANEQSSRSHCIHCVMVNGENLLNGEYTRSKLWLVDLAGSERIAKTEVQGERLKEAQNINRSLSALGDVISALSTKSPHIPFRNSKLTHLLQDSLGGDSKTLMFVQISPNENDLSETLCSLNFASRVRGVELGPAKKQVESSEILKYKQMAEKTKQEMKMKDFQIKKMEDTVHGLDIKIKEKDLKNKNLQEKIKELESQLLTERKLARHQADTKLLEQQQQQLTQRQEDASSFRETIATRPFGVNKNFSESKEQFNCLRPLSENNSYKPPLATPMEGLVKSNDLSEKENNPEMAEQQLTLPLPKRTGRASIGVAALRIPTAHGPTAHGLRRNSLIPLSISGTVKPPPLLPLRPIEADNEVMEEDEARSFPEAKPWDSPKEQKNGTKKLSSLLRKSIQKRFQMKSPLQHQIRRGGVNVDKVRVSIGSRGRMAQRIVRRATKDVQPKQIQREKERGWNIGTAGRTVL